jgi:AcrR family transcriptional regulator
MTNTSDIEQRIIEAAINCIERVGVKETTIRKIALEAGVNVAAINYYFRSKEQLMDRVQEITLNNAFDWSHFDCDEDATPKQRLVVILDHMVSGAQAYPEVTRSHFITPLVEKNSGTGTYRAFSEFMNKIYDDLVARGALPGADLRSALLQAAAASILGIGLHLDLFSDFSVLDMREPQNRRHYIEKLVDKLL